MKTFYWLLKRELWEHRGGFLWAPLITAAVFLALNAMGLAAADVTHGTHIWMGSTELTRLDQNLSDPETLRQVGRGLDLAMLFTAGLVALVTGFVVLSYCLGALYNDRRDRSILFWKSLPVSDTATVLSKVLAASVLAPAVSLVVGVVAGAAMLVLCALYLSAHGVGIWALLMQAHPLRVVATLLGLVPLHLLWALPTVGWLLLCSAAARAKPFLWAVVLPIGTGVVLGWFRLTGLLHLSMGKVVGNLVGRLLGSAFPGTWMSDDLLRRAAFDGSADRMAHYLDLSTQYRLLASPNLWIGVAAGVAMIAAAIWFRRWRDDS
jgi:ABC-2 type transport system permease protein